MSTSDPSEQERPRPPWIPTRVFISGASGFIGKSLAARYRQLGCEVRGVDKVADPKQDVVAGNTARVYTVLNRGNVSS
jgi:nucleoside-diphosphate-sugar epimerase